MGRERQYAVEILSRVKHGKYGRHFFFGMYLPGFSKKDAEEVAIEELAQMTINELQERTVDNMKDYWNIVHMDKTVPIGFENAEFFFHCKAYIE